METRPRTGGGGGDDQAPQHWNTAAGRALFDFRRGVVAVFTYVLNQATWRYYKSKLSHYSTSALSPDARHDAYQVPVLTKRKLLAGRQLRVHFRKNLPHSWRVLERLRIHGFRCTKSPIYFAFSPLEIEVRLRLWPTRRGSCRPRATQARRWAAWALDSASTRNLPPRQATSSSSTSAQDVIDRAACASTPQRAI